MTPHLAELLEQWAEQRELAAIPDEVAPELELAEAARQAWPKALLFTRVRGRRFAVVANLWAKEQRLYHSLEAADAEEVCERWRRWFAPPSGWLARLASRRPYMAEKAATRSVRTASCQQVVELGRDIDLAALPWSRGWPEERLAGTAAALVLLRPPEEDTYVGVHPVLCLDATRLCLPLDPEQRLPRLLKHAALHTQPVPAAVVLGPPPALLLAAVSHLPEELDRWQLAAAWQGKALETAPARTVELDVPAHAELVVEGTIDPQTPLEHTGPLAGPYGWYEPSRSAALFRAAAVTRRANPVLPMVVLGPPPHELETLHGVAARLLKPLACGLVPQLVDYSVLGAAGQGRVLAAAVRTRQAFDSRQTASLLWGWGHWLQARLLILVDEWVDVQDLRQVLLAVSAHTRMDRDVWPLSGPGGESDTHLPALHHCLVLDATCKSDPAQTVPGRLLPDAAASERVRQLLQQIELQHGHGLQALDG
ncbi:MAG: UbiD family decarboxylase [Pirellulales bacterium]|nr:UbiD family decarboxylase [Pirellulales bacterium]